MTTEPAESLLTAARAPAENQAEWACEGTLQAIRMDQLQTTVEALVRQALEGILRASVAESGPPAPSANGEWRGML